MNRIILCLVLVTFCLTQSAFAEDAKTRLRASSPKGTFETYRGATKLTKVQVKVKNVGEVAAKKVVVQVQLPGGVVSNLYGPTELAAKKEATYEDHPYDYVTSGKRLKAQVSCSNCYK